MHEPRQADKPPKKWLVSESGDFYVNGKKVDSTKFVQATSFAIRNGLA